MPVATGHQELLSSALKPAFIDWLPRLYKLGFDAGLRLSHGSDVIRRAAAVDSHLQHCGTQL